MSQRYVIPQQVARVAFYIYDPSVSSRDHLRRQQQIPILVSRASRDSVTCCRKAPRYCRASGTNRPTHPTGPNPFKITSPPSSSLYQTGKLSPRLSRFIFVFHPQSPIINHPRSLLSECHLTSDVSLAIKPGIRVSSVNIFPCHQSPINHRPLSIIQHSRY